MLAPAETAVRLSLFIVPFLLLPEVHAWLPAIVGKLPADLLILLGWGNQIIKTSFSFIQVLALTIGNCPGYSTGTFQFSD